MTFAFKLQPVLSSPSPVKVDVGYTVGLAGDFVVDDSAGENQFTRALRSVGRKLVNPLATVLRRPILPPEEWIRDPYYSGPLARDWWPRKFKDFIEAAQGDVTEIALTGAIGTGKTEIGKAICKYDLYRLSCFQDPQQALGMGAAEAIVYILVSLNRNKSIAKLYKPLRTSIAQTPYFNEFFSFDPRRESELAFPNNIYVRPGVTGEMAVHSEDVVFLFCTEANFMPVVVQSRRKRGVETLDVAADLVVNTVRRMRSRFGRQGGEMPMCRLILDSSRQYPDDFLERRILEIENERVGHKGVVIARSQWEAKEGATDPSGRPYFSEEKFFVEVGDQHRFSRILTPEQVQFARGRVIEVPVDMLPDFERDIEGSLRDFAGLAVMGLKSLFPRLTVVEECIRTEEIGYSTHQCAHPFTMVSTNFKDGAKLLEAWLFDPDTGKPRVNPDRPRCAHIDIGVTNDCLGLTIGHVEEMITITRGRDSRAPDLPCSTCRGDGVIACPRCGGTGSMTHWRQRTKCSVCRGAKVTTCSACAGTGKHGVPIDRPRIYIDLMLRVEPPENGQIQFDDVEALLARLRNLGMWIPVITADGTESAFFLQRQISRGWARIAEKLSVDKEKEPYYSLRNAMHDRDESGRPRLTFYEYGPLIDELMRLEDRPQKVDHPYGGCFVGSTRIPLLDGTQPQIKDLVGRGNVWVYSTDEQGRVVPGVARARQTKLVTQLVDVILDSGAVERCTPEHLWRLRDGTYKMAKDLRPGVDRLMPVKRVWPVNGGYERVHDLNNVRTLTHHMVWEHVNGRSRGDGLVHHLNGNKIDNRPENLECLPPGVHAHKHTAERHAQDLTWREKLSAGTTTFNKLPETRVKRSIAMKRRPRSWYVERAHKSKTFRGDITIEVLEQLREDPEATNATAAARVLGCGRNVVMRLLRAHCFDSWEAFKQGTPGNNHKVRAVVPVRLWIAVPVYDLEVDQWSNFSLCSGVVVHNSKDVSDSIAGVVYNCERLQYLQASTKASGVTIQRFFTDRNNHAQEMPR